MNWDPTSVLSIIITDQNNKIVVSNNITNTANVPNCNPNLIQRYYVQRQKLINASLSSFSCKIIRLLRSISILPILPVYHQGNGL